MLDFKDYAFVTEINGIQYYRHIVDQTDEIMVEDGKVKKLKRKIKEIAGDKRLPKPKKGGK